MVNNRFSTVYTTEWRRRHAERQKATLECAHRNCVTAADRFARRFVALFLDMQMNGLGLREIAAEMNERGYATRQGKRWTDQAVRQVLKRRKNIINSEVLNRPHYVGWDRRR